MAPAPADRYAGLPLPGDPRFTAHAAGPARHLGRLWADRLHHGLPATRRLPVLRVLGARVAEPVVGTVARALPGRPDPGLDRLLEALRAHWSTLAASSPRVPAAPPRLRALAMDTTMGRLSFVFGDGPEPLLVGRTPRPAGAATVQGEVQALRRLGDAGVPPRHLGRVGATEVQEGLPGRQLRLLPLQARPVSWTRQLDAALQGLTHVSRVTATDRGPDDDLGELIDGRSSTAGLTATSHRRAVAALRRATQHEASVLRHGDLSPQNVVCRGDALSGIVDWERAIPHGVAGFDPLHLAVSWIEKSVGSGPRRWTPGLVSRRFRQCWVGDFRSRVLTHVRAALRGAGLDADDAEQVEVAFFARRFARRQRPGSDSTDLEIAASALEHVCTR